MRRIFALLTTSFLFITAALSQEGLALAEKYNAAADSFANSSDYKKAILLRKKALNVYQNMRPVPYPQVVAEFRSLGIYFRRTGNNNEAAYNLKRAVELAEKKLDKNHIELAKAYNSLGVHALTKGSFEDALQLLSKSLDINERMQYPGVADNFNNLGIVYERLGNYKAAEEKYLQSLKYNLATLGFYKQNVADNYQNLGSASYQLGDFDRSLAYFDSALLIFDSIHPEKHPDFASLYNNIGAVHTTKGDAHKAIQFLDKSLAIYDLQPFRNHPDIANIYSNTGVLLLEQGDLNKALSYFQRAYVIRLDNFGPLHHLHARACNYLGDVFLAKKDFDEAYDWYRIALETWMKLPAGDPADLNEYRNDLGAYFEALGNHKAALEFYKKNLTDIQKGNGQNLTGLAKSYERIGNVLLAENNFADAEIYFRKALNINIKLFGNQHSEVAGLYRKIALSCPTDPTCALEYCDSAFTAVQYSFDSKPDFNKVASPITLLEILQTKGELLIGFYDSTAIIGQLHSANSIYQNAIGLIDFIKTTLEEPGSRQSLLNNFFLVYEEAILVKCKLKEATNDEKYWHEAFDLAEKSNATLLLEALQSADAEQFAGIPDSLLHKERQLKRDISFLEKQRFEEELKNNAQPYKLTDINRKIFELKAENSKLNDFIRRKYPKYFELKYATKTVSIQEIQHRLLRPEQSLLAYFTGENNVFAFVVSKNNFVVVPIKKDFPLEIWIEEFRHSIYRYNPGQKELQYLSQKYANIGHELFQLIFEPVKPFLKNQDIVVIPGGVIGYLPFDALLANAPAQYDDFDHHPYLIFDYQFSYCYSATLLKEMINRRGKFEKDGFIAFAPSYSGDTLDIRSDPWRAVLGRLRFNVAEALAIQKIMGGRVLSDSNATEENFRKLAPGASIIHLAAHGKANDEHGDYSYLAFYQFQDSVENELLFVKDLYSMRIKAALVVLSACESGIGELQRGEGILSLARGFSWAGAASIVTTLWSIDDSASAGIMEQFYKNLTNGQNKDAALRNAKLDFIKKRKGTNATHPLYWAAFVPVGDMGPLRADFPWWAVTAAGLLLLSLAGVYFLTKTATKPRGSLTPQSL
jgi:CHAT domain-containing protein/Tfp pilus assembly protein PilF